MRLRTVALFLLVWACFSAGRLCTAEAGEGVTAEEVQKAIDSAIEFLKHEQQANGSWHNLPMYDGGLTPLCTLALLNAGCTTEDESVKKAIDHIRGYRANSTYATSLQTMVLCAANPVRDRLLIARNVRWLESRQIESGISQGMWAQPAPDSPDHIDNSMTHMAMLALYEAERAGVEVHAIVWRRALEFWQRAQNPDGSWGWGPGFPGTGSMTCAGIAASLIASQQLYEGDATVAGDEIICCGNQSTDKHIEKAFQWLERNFSVRKNPGSKFWLTYYLYSLERVGRMSARRFIGRHDWYREGAEALVGSQLISGAWKPDVDEAILADPHVSTSFALMFLAKARRPVLIAQLKHDPPQDWNHHRRALFHLTSYVERAWQRDLTYQVVDLDAATVEELLDCPVLFLSGSETPQFSIADKQKLRMYVDRGGFIFAAPCCDSAEFDKGFRALMSEIFPEPDAKLRLLPIEHPAWHAEKHIRAEHAHPLWGVNVGCRTGVIYCPDDLSCLWEAEVPRLVESYAPIVRDRIEAGLDVGLNVLAYATDRDVKFKDPARQDVRPALPDSARGRAALRVASVLHLGGCHAAPAAVDNLLKLAAEQLGVRYDGTSHSLKLTDPALLEHHLIVMHGRTAFRFTAAERERLRQFLERGGTLFADAVCSSTEFSEAFRKEIDGLIPDVALRPIPPENVIFTQEYGGARITEVSRRHTETAADGSLKTVVREEAPTLEGLLLGDRYAVIFSPFDISCALDSGGTIGCEGYERRDAQRVALNVLMYSLHQ